MKQNLLMPLLCLNSGTGETMSRKPKRQGLDKAADKARVSVISDLASRIGNPNASASTRLMQARTKLLSLRSYSALRDRVRIKP
jgi:hypothetical protein